MRYYYLRHKTMARLCNSSWKLESPRRVACTYLCRARRKTSVKANGKHETWEMIYDGQFRAGVSQHRILSTRIVRGVTVKLKKSHSRRSGTKRRCVMGMLLCKQTSIIAEREMHRRFRPIDVNYWRRDR